MSEAHKKLREAQEKAERRKTLGLEKAIAISRRYAGVMGTAYIRDERGRERYVTMKDYLMMRDAGRKIELLNKEKSLEHQTEDARRKEQLAKRRLYEEKTKAARAFIKHIDDMIAQLNRISGQFNEILLYVPSVKEHDKIVGFMRQFERQVYTLEEIQRKYRNLLERYEREYR